MRDVFQANESATVKPKDEVIERMAIVIWPWHLWKRPTTPRFGIKPLNATINAN